MHEGRMQTGWRTANAGSRLKPPITQEGTVWEASLPAVLRENPPYGRIGGIEETSASFEARSAPRSYPTKAEMRAATRHGLLRGCTCRAGRLAGRLILTRYGRRWSNSFALRNLL